MLTKIRITATVLGAVIAATPAAGEVTRSTDNGFVTRHEVVVEADPKAVWLALITPADWWRSEHTWSGDAANLTLTPQAGGCFCETIPEADEPGRITLEGSVEHMRVIQAYPERALRMVGSLGPLQSEPVTGVLTIAISTVEKGTRIVWEYNVGGPMRYEIPVISKAVDGVMGAQLAALAKPLKVVEMPAPAKAPAPAEGAKPGGGSAAPAGPAPAPAPAKDAAPAPEAKPAAPAPAARSAVPASVANARAAGPAAKPVDKPADKPEAKPSKLEEAFRDPDGPRR